MSTVGRYFDGDAECGVSRWSERHPRSERTNRTNEHRISRVLDVEIEGMQLRDWDMRDLRPRHGGELVGVMLSEQKRSAGGCRNILRALSAMFGDAITDDYCASNPRKGLRVRDDDKRAMKDGRAVRVWTLEELHELASYAGRYEPMLRVLTDCGLRLGECLALRRADYEPGQLKVRGSAWEGRIVPHNARKNHDRVVPVPPTLDRMLRSMPVMLRAEWLFPTPSGCMWRESNWRRKVLRPSIERANEVRSGRRLDPSAQEMRHAWISHLRAKKIDPADLAMVAGHTVETESAVYTHALQHSLEEIRAAIG